MENSSMRESKSLKKKPAENRESKDSKDLKNKK